MYDFRGLFSIALTMGETGAGRKRTEATEVGERLLGRTRPRTVNDS